MRKPLAVSALVLGALFAPRATALVWPDVPDKVERALGAPDPNTRRVAAHELVQLGPVRGGALAIRALGDDDDEVKLAAADTAIHLKVAAATDQVIPWLGAREARLRRKACNVARALPNPRAVAPLSRVLGDPDPDVRQAAAEALGSQALVSHGGADAVAPLLGKLDDAHPAVRIAVVRALARLGDIRAVVPLVGKVQDSSQEVRQEVAKALGELGDLRASQSLLLQLRDNSNEVRREALQALGRLKAPDAVDAIAPFAQERVPHLRQAALTALGRIANKEAVRVLVKSLGTADDSGGGLERTPVRDALVSCGAAALPQLREVLEGPAASAVATSAAWVIGETRAQSEAPTLVAAMRRGTLPTAAALHALAGAGTSESVAVVLEFVNDPSPVVRAEAVSAAQKLLDPAHPDGRAVEPLAAALRDTRPTAEERAQLATLLGRTGAGRAAPVLTDLVSAPEPALRLAAIDALGMLGPAGADAPLLEKLTNADAQVRLHAAVALSESGGEKARDELLKRLDGNEEIDRSVLLTALGGVLSRAPSEQATVKITHALDLAAGPERDALIEALGRTPLPSALTALIKVASPTEIDDRRTVATLLSAHATAGRAEAAQLARRMLSDPDGGVRAQAAWALGTIGDAGAVSDLEALAKGADIDLAVDATGAIGRIAARAKTPDVAARALCPRETDTRAYVRVNALVGLSLAGARCGDGAPERQALADDTSDMVRAAAALAIGRSNMSADDKKVLDRCAATDHAGSVARRCRAFTAGAPPALQTQVAIPTHAHPVEVYVITETTGTPQPRTPYALLMADGLIRAGTADRRGAVFEPVAPEGEIALRRPSALAR